MGNFYLKGKRKVMFEIDYYDLDQAITKFLKEKNYQDKNFVKYGYECIGENEWSNYQSHSLKAEKEIPSEIDHIKDLSTNEILNWMCAEGLVEEGEYLVNVFW